jgi:hypothetical protein
VGQPPSRWKTIYNKSMSEWSSIAMYYVRAMVLGLQLLLLNPVSQL